MHLRFATLFVAASLSLIGAMEAFAAEPSAAGLWQALDKDSGEPTGWFLIRDRGGLYEGLIVRMFLKPGESADVVCDRCTDDRHNKPWLGLDIIRGMKRDGLNYNDGNILDPRYGQVYNAKMTLSPDGQTLVVRGYLGISLLGQDQYWTRLPEAAFNEIDPRFNPNVAAHRSKTPSRPPSRPTNAATH
ncbi:MAG: DUF2147 domain-containing protein [Hyphomicrobiales bacterium]|nr:DUF2147 domain-containing protein [Hyphomicrobiales bacterium]